MKMKDICKQYGLDGPAFETWLRQSEYRYKLGALGGVDVDDSQNIAEIVGAFQRHQSERQAAAEQAVAERQWAAQEKQNALDRMLVSSGFTFDGYTVTKYSGYISGDDVIQIDRGTSGIFARATDVGDSLMTSLAIIRRNALANLMEAAYSLGCNAVIGLDFDYLTLDPETAHSGGGTMYLPYVFGVTANGNAVVIEKIER